MSVVLKKIAIHHTAQESAAIVCGIYLGDLDEVVRVNVLSMGWRVSNACIYSQNPKPLREP